MARRGAGAVVRDESKLPPEVRRRLNEPFARPSREPDGERFSGVATPDEVWIEEAGPAPRVPRAPARTGPKRARRAGVERLPPDVAEDIARVVGRTRAGAVQRRLLEALEAFAADRAAESWRVVRPLLNEASGVAAVHEAAGLALYRLGRWSAAARELETFRQLAASVDRNPVLADCYRALRRFPKAEEMWVELRDASPGPELLTEGRIVAAGCRADQGDVAGAIALLERAVRPASKRKVRSYDARLWYALADLYERVGDTGRARELFARVVTHEPELADAASRLAGLA